MKSHEYVLIENEEELDKLIEEKVFQTTYGYLKNDKMNKFPAVFRLCLSGLYGMQTHNNRKDLPLFNKWLKRSISVDKYLKTKHYLVLKEEIILCQIVYKRLD